MIIKNGTGILINNNVIFEANAEIGHCTILGENKSDSDFLKIGENARIGAFCIIQGDTSIGKNAVIDDYCAIYSKVIVGDNLKLLYGKKIYGKSVLGNDCIIGGNIPERMILADRVTFMGEVAHSHYNPLNDWDTTDEPSPEIGEGTIIGVNALIIGGVKIGKNCYVSAGEILRHDLTDDSVYLKGKIYNISNFKGLIKTRY